MQLSEEWIKQRLYSTAVSIDDSSLLDRCIEEYSDYILSVVTHSGRVEKFVRNFFRDFPSPHREAFVDAVMASRQDPEEVKYVMTDIVYTLYWTRSLDTALNMVRKKYL